MQGVRHVQHQQTSSSVCTSPGGPLTAGRRVCCAKGGGVRWRRPPVRMPDERGLQVVRPRPRAAYRGAYSS